MLGRWPASPFDRMIAWPTRYRPFYSGVRARFPKGHTPLQHFYRTTRPTSLFRSVRLQRCSWLFHVNIQYSCASLDCVLRAAYIHYPGRIACPCVGFSPHDCCSTTAVLIPCDRFFLRNVYEYVLTITRTHLPSYSAYFNISGPQTLSQHKFLGIFSYILTSRSVSLVRISRYSTDITCTKYVYIVALHCVGCHPHDDVPTIQQYSTRYKANHTNQDLRSA